MSAVTSDNYAGGEKVAKYLISAGYEKIAYLAGWEGASTQRDREAGFMDTLNASGRKLFSRGFGNFEMAQSKKATLEMFKKTADHRPDVVFVANDHMALAVMDTLRYELGLKIPEDVAVVGYDDVPAAEWPSYDLTTVRQCSGQMVNITIDILLEEIESEGSQPRIVKIDGPLIIRGSSRKIKDSLNEGF
jgi:DNA-binding LacI/PurR family transcriptional regulator